MSIIKISVIVPIYNVENYLKECIDTLLNQDISYSDYEIILVNDGSTDCSGDIAKEYASKYGNILYLEQKNQGQAVARNYGLNMAKGKYILFIDSDDYMEANVLKLMMDTADEYDTEILISSLKIFHADGTCSISNDLVCYNQNMTGPEALLAGLNIGSACARLYKRSFLQDNNLSFETGIKHEDVYFNLNAYTLACVIRSINLCTYVYRWNDGSTDRSFDRNNVAKGIFSDLEIAFLENEMSSKYIKIDKKLSNYFKKQSNSLLVSNILTLSKRKMMTERSEYIRKAKDYSLYPICGRTNSWKSFLLGKLFNIFLDRGFNYNIAL